MAKLEGKIAVVTGGTVGIGLAAAQRFVAEGAYVFITGRRQAELDAAVKLIGKNVTGVRGDISNLADLDHLYAIIKQEKGHLDILFANAGGGEFAALTAITEAHINKIMDVNIKGTIFTVQKALPLMLNGSSIILTGSTTGSIGNPNFSVYGAAKAAIRSFARSWADELKDRQIRVNVVSPGPIATPGLSGLAPDASQSEQLLDRLAKTVPTGRSG